MVIEKYKSGFQPPEDIPFEDLSRESDATTLNSSTSKSSVINSHSVHGLRPDKTIKGTTSARLKKRAGLLGIFGSNKVSIKRRVGVASTSNYTARELRWRGKAGGGAAEYRRIRNEKIYVRK